MSAWSNSNLVNKFILGSKLSKLSVSPDLKVLITVFNSCTPIKKSSHFASILLPIEPS